MPRDIVIPAELAPVVERLRPELIELIGDPLDVAREEARRRGYEEGRRIAAEEASLAAAAAELALQERISAAITNLENAALFVRAQLSDELDRVAKGAAHLAMALTEAVLQRELELSRDPGSEALARALDLVPTSAAATVRCNPADLEQMGTLEHSLLTFVPDRSIGRGGCVLETGATLVDARIETALERVRAIFARAGGSDV